MSEKIMIVESPNKVHTIQKIVGDEIKVLASVGHILKLSTGGLNNLGIDFENWEPKMIPDPLKKTIISELKKAVKNADEVLIATDPDREGEAIANNLITTLKLENKYKRIKYNEITDEAIKFAIENPLEIDKNLVKAQKTRRMLDRIIGFRLSQLMMQKVKNAPTNPSAGRVQSIALKLVCDKEKEIENFNPILYSKINANLINGLSVPLYLKENKEFEDNTWLNREQANITYNELLNSNYELVVDDISVSKRKESAYTPFKQSVLYKEAKYSSKTVQSSAQKLFEAGLISYPRTDSTRLSESFINKAQKYITDHFGENYVAKEIKGFAGSQDAHEAIRPTYIELTPEEAKTKHDLNEIDFYIYKIIYDKTIMSLMTCPEKENYRFNLVNENNNFRMSFSKVIFDGYYAYLGKEEIINIPKLQIGDILKVGEFIKEDKKTLPPARYNEGSLIKKLDDIKVGRPSTFASTISVIKQRLFVELTDGHLIPTEFGKIVLEKLLTSFPKTINEEYTAKIEAKLDLISEGKEDYRELMQKFWDSFNERYDDVKDQINITVLEVNKLDENCPLCNSQLVYRYTKIKKQKFIGCSAFPNCHYIRNIETQNKGFFRRRKAKK
ncbi:type I DNA topoisomerase [Mycoplasmopsis arginini]|uniref:DNA topoisomerase 1 n=1 Tax=Mycoplasmopsis arginini TaxID=2094 RepID=A0ABZ2AML9_MYCAR|nr:type I DNA topoisomerase [Mycoplasmopsis arginini]WVN22152.1 type I DNA topoisomerase [Mycoplasmopsis arginini]VEU81554.1 DNA topoisomerase 1 [Mycoplasmopsis arginini]